MYIGIDLGGTNIAAAIVNDEGKILISKSVKTQAQRPSDEIVKDMANLCLTLIEEGNFQKSDIKSIGIGTPGTVDSANGTIIYACSLPFDNLNIVKEMQKYIDVPVYVDNDANCAALGEFAYEHNKNMKCFVAITLGTGVGSGVIIDGKIFSGCNGSAVEFGHVVSVIGGKQCTCGRKGCIEQYASANALIAQTKEAIEKDHNTLMYEMIDGDIEKVSGKTAFAAAKKGDALAKQVVDQYITYVGECLVNLINIFQPEVIKIGGGISKEGDFLINPLKEYVEKEVYCLQVYRTEIKTASLGNDAGIIGAAFLGKEF